MDIFYEIPNSNTTKSILKNKINYSLILIVVGG
jgi:hypothetical protein